MKALIQTNAQYQKLLQAERWGLNIDTLDFWRGYEFGRKAKRAEQLKQLFCSKPKR
jgi:hypothetical protein